MAQLGVSGKRKIGRVIYHTFCLALCYVMLYPMLWMVFSSFKETGSIFTSAAKLLPENWTFENYGNGWRGFSGNHFGVFFKNSLFVTTLATVGAVASSAVIAFGFARIRFFGSRVWFACMMITLMLPFQVIMVPQFLMFQKFGWNNTYLPLIVPYWFGQAFFIFLDMQFMQGIPTELDEAARIDGCSTFGVFYRIMLPLISPALITTAIFSFIWRWEDFLAPLLYLSRPETYTISMALKMFSDPSSQSDWGAMFAMAALSLLPAFILFAMFQKYLVEGVATSGLKG